MGNFCVIDGCGAKVENRDLGLCATHNKARRLAEKPAAVKPKKALRPASAKKQVALAAKAVAYAEVDKRGMYCETCGRPAGQVLLSHSHILPVGQFPEFEAVPDNIILQCYGSSDSCHDVFEHNKYLASQIQKTWPHCAAVMKELAPAHYRLVMAKIAEARAKDNAKK